MKDLLECMQALDDLTNNKDKKISKIDYELFCKEFVFDKLKGKNFGKAFCEKFNFNDLYLKYLTDDTAKYQIENLGYIEK